MPSSTLTLYRDNTNTVAFNLVSTSEYFAKWIVTGRALSVPYSVTQLVKPSKGAGNDLSYVTIARTEANATTGKLATCLVEVKLSAPKDQSILTPAVQKELISLAASALIDGRTSGTTNTNASCIVEGRIL